jgi:uncharacterized protein YjbI with pentapeptide repeats
MAGVRSTRTRSAFSRRQTWALATVAVLALLPLVIYVVPVFIVRSDGDSLTAAERLKAENDIRSTLLQALAGAILLAGLYFTARTLQVNTRTLEVNREGQITERFTRAIDQLGQPGDDKLAVRLGGIYALERIARDSREDHGPVMEVLTAFVREAARWRPGERTSARDDAEPGGDPDGVLATVRPRPDVQAAVTVLGRRNRDHEAGSHTLDLPRVDLRGANLRAAHFEGATLREAHLEGADLGGAYLHGASLRNVHLDRAILLGTHLQGADLGDASLNGASLRGAHLQDAALGGAVLDGADLADAHLGRAFLGRAQLKGANLSYADLEGAFLHGADLEHAVLYGARLDEADLGEACLAGADVTRTDLSRAQGLKQVQLDGVARREGATLPSFPSD